MHVLAGDRYLGMGVKEECESVEEAEVSTWQPELKQAL